MTTPDESLAALVILLSLVLGVALYIWTALALAALFRKLGEPAWQGWIPLWNVAVILKWGGFSPWLVLLALLPGVGALIVWILLVIAAHRLGPGFGYGAGMTVLAALLFVVWASILGFGPARWLGARRMGAAATPAAPTGPTPESAALFAPRSRGDDTPAWLPPSAPAPSASTSSSDATGPAPSAPAGTGPAAPAGFDPWAPEASAPVAPAAEEAPTADGRRDSAPVPPASADDDHRPAGPLRSNMPADDGLVGPRRGTGADDPAPGVPLRPAPAAAPDADDTIGPRRTGGAADPAPGFSAAPRRDDRAPATPASGHVNAQRPPAAAFPGAGTPASTRSTARDGEPEVTAPAGPEESVDAWGSELDEVSAVSPSPFPPSAAGSPRHVGTPVDTTGDPISFVPGRTPAVPPTTAAPVTRLPARDPEPEPEPRRVRQWPASHYDPDVFPEMSGEVSAVVGSPAAGAPLSARRSVPAQEADPEPDEDDFDHTVIARRKRPAWQLIPATGRPIALTSDVVILGRQPAPDPAHPRAQLVALDDRTRTVSKTHARLQLHADGWQLTDLHSTNGVLLPTVLGTEVEIEPGSTVPAGERFLLGDAELRLVRAEP